MRGTFRAAIPLPPPRPHFARAQSRQPNDEFLTLHSTSKHAMMRIAGSINGKPATILIDSGASTNFVERAFWQKHNLCTVSGKTTRVTLADGSRRDSNQ